MINSFIPLETANRVQQQHNKFIFHFYGHYTHSSGTQIGSDDSLCGSLQLAKVGNPATGIGGFSLVQNHCVIFFHLSELLRKIGTFAILH